MTTWQPFDEPLRATLARTVGIAIVAGGVHASLHLTGDELMTAPWPYPTQRTPLTLPSGHVVVILNLVVSTQAGQPGGAFTVQYETRHPASQHAARQAEAVEVVEAHRAWAEAHGFDVITAAICNTLAAAEMREMPEVVFYFKPGVDGRWILDHEAVSRVQ